MVCWRWVGQASRRLAFTVNQSNKQLSELPIASCFVFGLQDSPSYLGARY